MRIGPLDTDARVVVVAEIGNNHEGDEGVAARMLDAAVEAGADAVKFQTFRAATYQSPTADPKRYGRLRKFELPSDAFRRLAARARERGVVFFSSPFDLPSVDLLDPMVPVFKIASADNTFWPLLERVARTGKPVILSTGLSDAEGVRRSKAFLEEAWRPRGISPALALLHCVSAYPVAPAEASLRAIPFLRDAFPGTTVGYSDHTVGIEACCAAAALGARIIEKHFTLDHAWSDFRDHQLSATPQEMGEIVRRVREVEPMLGRAEKVLQPCERSNLGALRRSISAARDLPAGAVLAPGDLMWIRPAGGRPPGDEGVFLGRTLGVPRRCGDLLEESHLEGGMP